MTAWQTDDEYVSVRNAVPLPTPAETLSRTPSLKSKRSKRSITPPGKSGSPCKVPNGEKASQRSSKVSMEESLSILDPRRFTPTLHANLVSEILALRRDQEEKTKLIENLESALHTSREEQEALQENIAHTSKESRSLKRQLSLLEGGTSSALGELARERDEAVDSVTDARKRLEAAQKRIRNQEDDSQRVHELWAQEKEDWEDEKRKFERRLHVTESRLKTVLEEMESYQASLNGAQDRNDGQDIEGEDSGRENDTASVRTMSMTNSIRFTFTGGLTSLLNGNSLADELNLDDTDDQTDLDGVESIMSSPRHKRNYSRDSVAHKIHNRNCSTDSLKKTTSNVRGRRFINRPVLEVLEGEDEEVRSFSPMLTSRPTYTDTGIQYSPPPSPKMEELSPMDTDTPEPESLPQSDYFGDKAGDGLKRVSRQAPIEPLKPLDRMVSSAAQTAELPLTPPKTPRSIYTDSATSMEPSPCEMVSSSTQTEALPYKQLERAPSVPFPLTLEIPSISVEPPESMPTSPAEPRLPQYFKHFGCQVNLNTDVVTASSGSQTESIQTDKRLALLPHHLQPSSITSRPPSPNPSVEITGERDSVPQTSRHRHRFTKGSTELPSSPVSLGGLDDDLRLQHIRDDAHAKGLPIRRPRRFGSFHSGIYSGSSDDMDEFGDADISDSEFRTALSAPRPPSTLKRSARYHHHPPLKSPASPEEMRSSRSSARSIRTELYSSYTLGDKHPKSGRPGRNLDKPLPSLPHSARGTNGRKAPMAHGGMTSRYTNSSSPSLNETIIPPFPIPARASSRKPSISASIGSDGRESVGSKTSAGGGHYRGQLRRVRSSNTLARNARYQRNGSHGSRSPPLSPSTEVPETPALPPLPRNGMGIAKKRARDDDSNYRGHRSQRSTNTDVTTNTEMHSQTGSQQQTPGVVEAIAQTMVGEWMFKYMRRRKSFGVTDNTSKDENSNDRHKRWVWLAPYERAILWSSKQPSSGSALMGKAGRKLIIQSVLDVKDDNPAPRGVNAIFDRSILILTPQRALKFTASTAERHYLWLTALSFLAHSSHAVSEILSPTHLSVQQQPLPNLNVPHTKMKRGGIKDSIRLAKGRRIYQKQPADVPGVPSATPSQMSEDPSFQMPELPQTPMGAHGHGFGYGQHSREPSEDAAEPPMIPRFNGRYPGPNGIAHGRKRSNTGGHIHPPLSFRGFSGPLSPASTYNSANNYGDASMMMGSPPEAYHSHGLHMTWANSPSGVSEVSTPQGNFFDAIGTVRMEAFISPLAFSQSMDYPGEEDSFRYSARRRSKELRRKHSRNRNRNHPDYHFRGRRGYNDSYGGHRTAGEEDYDPFPGF